MDASLSTKYSAMSLSDSLRRGQAEEKIKLKARSAEGAGALQLIPADTDTKDISSRAVKKTDRSTYAPEIFEHTERSSGLLD